MLFAPKQDHIAKFDMLFGGNFEGLVFETELKIKISIVIHFIKMSNCSMYQLHNTQNSPNKLYVWLHCVVEN